MREAFKESLKGAGIASPNPAVGCVIVKDGVELARGHTQAYGGRHAEREAFALVKNPADLQGATVYVTLEPCSHFGHQPPCSALLAQSGVKRIVVGRKDPDKRVQGRGLNQLTAAGKIISVGHLAKEITAWNYPFFLTRSNPEPVVGLIWTPPTGDSSRTYARWLRRKYDIVLTDIATYLKNPSIIQRQAIFDQAKKTLTLSTNGKQEKIMSLSAVNSSGPSILQGLKAAAAKVMTKPLQSILIEGEPSYLAPFLNTQIVDVVHTFVPRDSNFSLPRCTAQDFDVVATAQLKDDFLIEMTPRSRWLKALL